MHVLLFFLVPTYLRELNAAARDKTIRGILAKRQAVSRGGKRGSPLRWGREMHRARVHLRVGYAKGGERNGREMSAAGRLAHVTRGGGRSSTRTRTGNVKLARRPRSPVRVPRCNGAAFRGLLNVHFSNSEPTF